ncbi:hypothetical protein J2T13_002541 [Paenibacillus sp. DS2015]
MRRYWFSILISLFIIVGLGTYYVYGATDRLPEYKLLTIEGDVKEGAKIQLQGSYIGGRGSEIVTVTTEGSDYPSRQSVYRKELSGAARSWLYAQPDIREVIKDHRSFMRGKGSYTSLYKDEEWIIYAEPVGNSGNISSSKVVLNIDILNLSSGKVRHFEPIIEEQVTHSFVTDVQLIDDQIHVLSLVYPLGDGDNFDYHDYIVDMNSGTLMNNLNLTSGFKVKDNTQLNFSGITNDTFSAPSDHAILVVLEEKKLEKDNQGRTLFDEYPYSYEYKTGKLTALSDIQKGTGLTGNGFYRLEGSLFSSLRVEPKLITMSRYNIETGKADNDVISLTAQQIGADAIKGAIMKAGRIYILFHKNGIPMATVVDETNGDIVYKGEVVFDGDESERKEHLENVQLLNMQIVE